MRDLVERLPFLRLLAWAGCLNTSCPNLKRHGCGASADKPACELCGKPLVRDREDLR